MVGYLCAINCNFVSIDLVFPPLGSLSLKV